MKKTVEIEYVGIEDLQDILDDVYALQREGHYISFEVSNIGANTRINIDIWLGGWGSNKNKDYEFEFYMTDSDDNVAAMNKCKSILRNLLAEEQEDEII